MDVGINSPVKAKVKSLYMNWQVDRFLETRNISDLKPPSKQLVAEWILKGWNELPQSIIVQSFKKPGLVP